METPTRTTDGAAPRGYTLAESLVASVVLAVAVVGVAGVLGASYKQSAVRGNTTTAISLAQQLMEEIAAKPLTLPAGQDQPGWSAGQTNRWLYDTVGDYHGYSDVSAALQMQDGTTIDAGDGGSYVRVVTVQPNARPAGLPGNVGDFSLVTVTVDMPYGQQISLSQLLSSAKVMR